MIVPRIALAALLAAATAVPAQAAGRAEIRLRGVVPAVCTVSVSNDMVDLNIVGGEAGTQIATVTEQCNAAGGYTVSVESANGLRMVPAAGGAGIGYGLAYDNAAQVTAGALVAERSATGAVRQRTLVATLPPSPQANAGSYADTVTVSISAK